MATNAVQALLNLTDLWFIGRLSTDAVAAMGAIYWILTCAVLLFGGVGLAVQTFVAQAFGSRRKARASRALWNALWATLAHGAAVPGAGVCRARGCCIPSDSIRTSRRWRSNTGRRAWAAHSSARWPGPRWDSSTASPRCATPWLIVVVTTVSNAIANQFFMFELGMGMKGSAWGTNVAQLIGLALAMVAVPARRDRRGVTARRSCGGRAGP